MLLKKEYMKFVDNIINENRKTVKGKISKIKIQLNKKYKYITKNGLFVINYMVKKCDIFNEFNLYMQIQKLNFLDTVNDKGIDSIFAPKINGIQLQFSFKNKFSLPHALDYYFSRIEKIGDVEKIQPRIFLYEKNSYFDFIASKAAFSKLDYLEKFLFCFLISIEYIELVFYKMFLEKNLEQNYTQASIFSILTMYDYDLLRTLFYNSRIYKIYIINKENWNFAGYVNFDKITNIKNL